MNTGQIISGVGHVGLVAFAVFGGTFQSEPLPFEVTEVTAISAEEFAALFPQEVSPEAVANVDTPEPPSPGEAPDLSSLTDTAPELEQPEAADTPPPDPAPDVSDLTPPAEADVSDDPPVLDPPTEDTAALVPAVPQPETNPAPRVAPEPVAQPDPDVQIDDVDQQETAPDDSADIVEDAQEETARQEAATEIATEADDVSDAAPTRSIRPRGRPAARPEPEEGPQAAETPEAQPTDNSAVEDAIAAALGATETDTPTDRPPSGPPLTAGEKDALRVAVQQCWNVGSLSTDALNTTVVVAVTMFENGRPDTGSIRMLSFRDGSESAARQAFEAARRAIIRCGANGFNLPPDKFDHWRDIEMTFNPERMRIK